jgi:UDP-N-acetylmuramoyl-tripeptide--D-alanyl-D-alanine ligase
MNALWTSFEIAKATGGTAIGDWQIKGLSIDTRTIKEGDLFIPLKDERDGHDFIDMAYDKGAASVISEKDLGTRPHIRVADSFKALQDLAIAARQRSSAKRIAVTGSVGKTTVKEMLAHVLRAYGKTHASQKSYNNHWGVPLTLASMPKDCDFGVFEMGMNHAGELRALSNIVCPNVAAITKIAPAHLAHFTSLEDIALAKAEVFEGLASNGIAITPSSFQGQNVSRETKTFGYSKHDDAYIASSTCSKTRSEATVNIKAGGRVQSLNVVLPFGGKHWIENAALALLIAREMGIEDLDIAVNALKNMPEISGRGEIHKLSIEGKGVELLDESYNANPASMAAALNSLGLYEGRKIAVLGDMLELGATSDELHAGLCGDIVNQGIDLVMMCGTHMQSLADILPAPQHGGLYENAQACLDALRKQVQDGDTIMIKGSNASGMHSLVQALKQKYLIQKNSIQKNGEAHVI